MEQQNQATQAATQTEPPKATQPAIQPAPQKATQAATQTEPPKATQPATQTEPPKATQAAIQSAPPKATQPAAQIVPLTEDQKSDLARFQKLKDARARYEEKRKGRKTQFSKRMKTVEAARAIKALLNRIEQYSKSSAEPIEESASYLIKILDAKEAKRKEPAPPAP